MTDINLSGYPHIVQVIVDAVSEDDVRDLIPLRGVCKPFKAAIDRRLFAHVVIDSTERNRLVLTLPPRLDGTAGGRLPVDPRMLDWLSNVPRWFVDHEWPQERERPPEQVEPATAMTGVKDLTSRPPKAWNWEWVQGDMDRRPAAESPRSGPPHPGEALPHRRPWTYEYNEGVMDSTTPPRPSFFKRQPPPLPVAVHGRTRDELLAEFSTQSTPRGQAMKDLVAAGVVERHLAALATTARLFLRTYTMDVTATAAMCRGTRLVLRLTLEHLDTIRFTRQIPPSAAFVLNQLSSRRVCRGTHTVVFVNEPNTKFDLVGEERAHSGMPDPGTARHVAVRQSIAAPHTVSLPPFALPTPAAAETNGKGQTTKGVRLVFNFTFGAPDSFRLGPLSQDIREVVVIMPKTMTWDPARHIRHDEWESPRQWIMKRTAELVYAVSLTARFSRPGDPINVLVVGLPVPVEPERTAHDVFAQSMAGFISPPPRYRFESRFLTTKIYTSAKAALRDGSLARDSVLDNVTFVTRESYRDSVGDAQFMAETRALAVGCTSSLGKPLNDRGTGFASRQAADLPVDQPDYSSDDFILTNDPYGSDPESAGAPNTLSS